MLYISYLFIFLLGLAFGSFLNCLVYRLYQHQTIFGRSYCPQCRNKLDWFDNIPLISFVFLKGRCRNCQKKISWQYPLVELIMGLLFVLSIWRFSNQQLTISAIGGSALGGSNQLLLSIFRDWIIFFALVFTFVYDFKYLQIQDIVILPAAGLVFILNLFSNPLFDSLIGMSILFRAGHMLLAILIAVGFFALQYLATKGRGIGLGDLRIGLFMGAALAHWSSVCLALFFSYIIGALISLILVAFKQKKITSQIPLGPFLTIGTLIALLFGQQIINWYIR